MGEVVLLGGEEKEGTGEEGTLRKLADVSVPCQRLQEEGAQEVTGGVCFPDAQEGGVSGNGGKGEPGGHEGGGGVLQKGSFGWRLINFYAEELSL